MEVSFVGIAEGITSGGQFHNVASHFVGVAIEGADLVGHLCPSAPTLLVLKRAGHAPGEALIHDLHQPLLLAVSGTRFQTFVVSGRA